MQISKNKAVFGMLAFEPVQDADFICRQTYKLAKRGIIVIGRGVFAYVMGGGNDQNRRPQRQRQR